jgi:hypothetical protein
MRILVDLDGPIFNFTGNTALWCAGKTGRPLSDFPVPTTWAYWEEWGFGRREFYRLVEQGVVAGFVFGVGDPVLGARGALRRLRRAGHRVHIATSRGFGPRSLNRSLTATWLGEHKIPHDSLTFAEDKTVLRVDVALDDKPSNVNALRAIGTEAFLYDLGRKDQADHPFLVAGWPEFEVQVEALC